MTVRYFDYSNDLKLLHGKAAWNVIHDIQSKALRLLNYLQGMYVKYNNLAAFRLTYGYISVLVKENLTTLSEGYPNFLQMKYLRSPLDCMVGAHVF
jgi:hypothetical protein